jgi:O-antigen ligase
MISKILPPHKLPNFSLYLIALMCVVPFLIPHHRLPLTTFYGEWIAATLGLLASTLLLRRASWQPFRLPVMAIVPLGLLVIFAIQIPLGLVNYWQQNFLLSLYLLWATLLIVLGAELKREFGLPKVVSALAWAVFIGGVLNILIVVLQISGVGPASLIIPHHQANNGANLSQVNHLANYLGLALGSLIYLYITAQIKPKLAILFAILLLFPIALTGQRMGWLYVLILAIGGWLATRKFSQTAHHLKPWLLLLLIPAFIAVQYIIPLLPISGLPLMPSQKVVAGFQGASIRLELVKEAWQIFLANPLLGIGFAQFGWQDFKLAETFNQHVGWYHHTHNIVLHLMVEAGLVGGLLMVVGAVYFIGNARRVGLTPERFWIYALLAVLAIHSSLEYPLWYAYFLGIAAIILGLGDEKFIEWKMDLGPIAIGSVILFGAISLVNIGTHYYKLEDWFDRGQANKIKPAEMDAMLDEMLVIRNQSLLAPYIDFVVLRMLPNVPELLSHKLAISTQVIKFIPGDKEVYQHATLLALSNQLPAAQQQLKYALIRYPTYANEYAVQLLRQGDARTMPLIASVLQNSGKLKRQALANKKIQ